MHTLPHAHMNVCRYLNVNTGRQKPENRNRQHGHHTSRRAGRQAGRRAGTPHAHLPLAARVHALPHHQPQGIACALTHSKLRDAVAVAVQRAPGGDDIGRHGRDEDGQYLKCRTVCGQTTIAHTLIRWSGAAKHHADVYGWWMHGRGMDTTRPGMDTTHLPNQMQSDTQASGQAGHELRPNSSSSSLSSSLACTHTTPVHPLSFCTVAAMAWCRGSQPRSSPLSCPTHTSTLRSATSADTIATKPACTARMSGVVPCVCVCRRISAHQPGCCFRV